jgi:hypothetical protein
MRATGVSGVTFDCRRINDGDCASDVGSRSACRRGGKGSRPPRHDDGKLLTVRRELATDTYAHTCVARDWARVDGGLSCPNALLSAPWRSC